MRRHGVEVVGLIAAPFAGLVGVFSSRRQFGISDMGREDHGDAGRSPDFPTKTFETHRGWGSQRWWCGAEPRRGRALQRQCGENFARIDTQHVRARLRHALVEYRAMAEHGTPSEEGPIASGGELAMGLERADCPMATSCSSANRWEAPCVRACAAAVAA